VHKNQKPFPELPRAPGHTSGKAIHTSAAHSLGKASRINRTSRPLAGALACPARGIQMNLLRGGYRLMGLNRVNRPAFTHNAPCKLNRNSTNRLGNDKLEAGMALRTTGRRNVINEYQLIITEHSLLTHFCELTGSFSVKYVPRNNNSLRRQEVKE
jgi:hypothetical protein